MSIPTELTLNSMLSMMTSSNGNIFRVTGPLCGEFIGPGEFPSQRPVTRCFDVFFDLRLNKRLSKPTWGWWFETPSWSLWRHRNFYFPGEVVTREEIPRCPKTRLVLLNWLSSFQVMACHYSSRRYYPNIADLRSISWLGQITVKVILVIRTTKSYLSV